VSSARPKPTPLELLAVVRDVSIHVAPDAPTEVAQRPWNEGRAGAGHPDAPAAHSIAERLGVSWRRLLQIAHGSRDDALRALGNAAADKRRKGLTLDRVSVAVRQAARRLGKPGIDRSDYTRGRELILAATRRGPARQTVLRALPELTQIETVLGQNDMSWDDLLAYAELERAERTDNRGLDELAAIRLFVETVDKLPRNAKQLKAWANAAQVSVRKPLREPFEVALARIVAERTAAGEPPLTTTDRGQRFDGTPAVTGAKRARKVDWDRQQIIRGLAKAIRILDGRQLTQRSLREIAPHQPDVPSWAQVDRCRRKHHPDETWNDWVAEATALARNPDP
jgi:hypothetical protein